MRYFLLNICNYDGQIFYIICDLGMNIQMDAYYKEAGTSHGK